MGVLLCTVTFRDGDHRVIQAEVHASTLFHAIMLALDVSRPDRQHPIRADTDFAITAPNGEERFVRYGSLAEHQPGTNVPARPLVLVAKGKVA